MKCLILSLAFILASIQGSDGHGVSQLSALRKALLDGYDKDVKPDEAVESKLSVHINDLSLCPKKQVLTTSGWLMMSWTDSRLTWDPEDFGGLKRLRVNAEQIWVPDVTLYNAVEPPKSSYVTWEDTTNAIVMSDGMIIFVPPATLKSHCNVNYEDWPWGTQNCTLKFGSWTYDKENVDILANVDWGSCPDVSMTWSNQLQILDSSCVRQEKTYDCCPDEIYPSLDINVQFKFTEKFMDDKLEKSP